MRDVPADFAIKYEVRESSVPTPDYSEYTLTLDARGHGEIEFRPDYDFNRPPTWRVTFRVPSAKVSRLYGLIRRNGVLARAWNKNGPPDVGGRTRTADIRGAGSHVSIPENPEPERADIARELYAAIENLIEEGVWRDLRQRQVAYQAAYRRRT